MSSLAPNPTPRVPARGKVPEPIRELAYVLFRPRSARAIGRALYGHAAKACARSYLAAAGTREAHLVGGMLRECVPAVSDLDFLLVSGPELDDAAAIAALGQRHRRLKRVFPAVGEVQIVARGIWELRDRLAGPWFWYARSRRFDGKRFLPPVAHPLPPIPAGSRFAYCLDRLQCGVANYRASRLRGGGYLGRAFVRDLRKAVDFAHGVGEPVCEDTDVRELFTTSFLALDRLARAALAAPPRSTDLVVTRGPGGPPRRFSPEGEAFRRHVGGELHLVPTARPDLVAVSAEDVGRTELEALAARYLELLDAFPQSATPLPVSPAMAEAIRMGWHADRAQSILWHLGDETVDEKRLAATLAYRLVELVSTDLYLLRGSLAGAHPESRRALALDLCANAMMLAGRCASPDRGLVTSLGRSILPDTAALAEALGALPAGSPWTDALVERALGAAREVETFVASRMAEEPRHGW